jgi:hypothetical protein
MQFRHHGFDDPIQAAFGRSDRADFQHPDMSDGRTMLPGPNLPIDDRVCGQKVSLHRNHLHDI